MSDKDNENKILLIQQLNETLERLKKENEKLTSENKKFHINLNNEKKLYLLKNPKILDNNRLNSKEKMKKIFPNLISHNKNC